MMANPNFDRHKAARTLLDAAMLGDRAAAEKHRVTVQSISRYRRRLDGDPELLKVVQELKVQQDAAWADEIPSAIAASIEFLKGAAQQLDPRDPKSVVAVSAAVSVLAEVLMVREVIDTRRY